MQNYDNVDEYLANFSGDTRNRLDAVRAIIKDTVPSEAIEKISYGIPTFYLNGNLIHFAGYKSHVGLYPGSVPIKEFAGKLKGYKTSKGTVQFPMDKPLPLDLISQIIEACVIHNQKKKKWPSRHI